MTKARSSPKRNVESIRRKNLEDNQLFLEKLLMTNIRNDFVNSARSILRKDGSDQIKKHFPRQYQKVEHATRYNRKVKSGEIAPHVPEWQRKIERKKIEKEQEQQRKEMRRQAKEMERQEKQREKEMKRQAKEIERQAMEIERQKKQREKEMERQEKQREKEMKRQAKEIERQAIEIERKKKQQEKEMEREEKLFEEEFKKIEKILKFEEEIKIKRAERHRRYGLSKWELLYHDPQRSPYNLRHTKPNK